MLFHAMLGRSARCKTRVAPREPTSLAVLLVGLLAAPSPGSSARGAHHRAEPPAGHVALTSAPPQKTVLSLPFDGVWAVIQGMGGKGTHTGYAYFALDLVPAERVTDSAFRKRKQLAQHSCYGRPILAPADGRVVWARDGARELPPFRETRKHEAGNFVILKHASDEFTEFRHLQRGSIAVKLGDDVRAGQTIGRCGNSGNAVTPHLHFAFLGSFQPIATRPMRLSNYQVMTAQGAWETGDGVPKQGQILRPVPSLGAAPPQP